MDYYDLLRASMGGGSSPSPAEERTYTGEPPLEFESNGEPAIAYSITGNMASTGTPSPANPVYPQECGDLVESGAHAGEYAIPITVGGETTTIYLDEPLRKFGEYADVLDSAGTITRRVHKITLTGSESWSYTSSMQKMLFTPSNFPGYLREAAVIGFCSHYEVVQNQTQASIQSGQLTFLISSSGTNTLYLRDSSYTDADTFKAHLAALYAAGTPVCVWYVLAEAETETITAPQITPAKGTNTLAFETDLRPSAASITCMVGGGGSGGTSASKVTYSNTASGLAAVNVQKAIDEVAQTQARLYGPGFARETGNLAAGESLTFPATNCKKNGVYEFTAAISSFTGLLIGQGFETYGGAWVEITATKLIVHNYAQSDSAVEYTHGLTIEDYIGVQIVTATAKADITITSGGATFKQANATWSGCNGAYFAESAGSALTGCVFTWACPDFRKAVWVFGDSYVGLNNPARWVTQLRNAGYAENVLINGYAGEASAAAVTALENALAYGRPKALVWCLGMNDGADSGSTPSANWTAGVTQAAALCKTYGVELIQATIPSVPNQSNEAKNAAVRSSGRRYIDFAQAVGASASGVWFDGMLSQDNVHPTELGAVALFHRAIADCPELTFPNP